MAGTVQFGLEAVLAKMAMAECQSAVQPPSAPATSAELQLVLQLLRSLNERMERLERQGGWQPRQKERPEGSRKRRRRRKPGRSQMRCYRCRQPGHFARDCRAPAPIGSTGGVVRRETESGGKGVPALADTGVVSTGRRELGVGPGRSSSTIRPPILTAGPAAPKPAVLPPGRKVKVVPPVASGSRRITAQPPLSRRLIRLKSEAHVPLSSGPTVVPTPEESSPGSAPCEKSTQAMMPRPVSKNGLLDCVRKFVLPGPQITLVPPKDPPDCVLNPGRNRRVARVVDL
ncbi:hypothetical protein EGW08_017269 [Elysia chlorotica]|uniref:CCHC-type domain-containing protein n=1 Tax=Elysia chlorotica TaxID=188477 RepID=A0A433T075_ELYCH|nr:hypothetical protein EGW08_017269 [Elysia chlorotica]